MKKIKNHKLKKMEKLKFALQVFTAIVALPVLTMMELNHSPKNLEAQQEIRKQEVANTAEGYYFNTGGKANAAFKKNNTAVKAAND
jgi:Trk-type K+ transport system membrane component